MRMLRRRGGAFARQWPALSWSTATRRDSDVRGPVVVADGELSRQLPLRGMQWNDAAKKWCPASALPAAWAPKRIASPRLHLLCFHNAGSVRAHAMALPLVPDMSTALPLAPALAALISRLW